MNRYNTKKCKHCGKATSVMAERVNAEWKVNGIIRGCFLTDTGAVHYGYYLGWDESAVIVPCRGCGALRVAQKVLGKVRNEIRCDGRCESATGHNCECQCGGKNHGRAHAA